MTAFDKAWKVLKEHSDFLCELCHQRKPFDEHGGFTDYGPHCQECEQKKCPHCNGEAYHYDEENGDWYMCDNCDGTGVVPPSDITKSEAYDGESESSCTVCGKSGSSVKPTGSGMMACQRPVMEDYLPMDGDGYAGAMLQYQQCQRQARGE
jgi:hypothetical protein